MPSVGFQGWPLQQVGEPTIAPAGKSVRVDGSAGQCLHAEEVQEYVAESSFQVKALRPTQDAQRLRSMRQCEQFYVERHPQAADRRV